MEEENAQVEKDKGEVPKSWTGPGVAKTIVGVVATAAAVLAAMYAKGQIDVADQQKIVAEQTQLLTLVIDIEQVDALIATPQLRPGAMNNGVELENELTTYAQAAQTIIGSLKSDEVAPFEYVQVAKALVGSDNNLQAIRYFRRAARANSAPPDTVAAADRNWASVLYSLDEPTAGHQRMMQAVAAFAARKYVAGSDSENNVAQSYLADAGAQLAIKGCQLVRADITAAEMNLPLLREKPLPAGNYDASLLIGEEHAERTDCPA